MLFVTSLNLNEFLTEIQYTYFLGRECDPLLLYLSELLVRNKQMEIYNCACIYIYNFLYIKKDGLECMFNKLYLDGLIIC